MHGRMSSEPTYEDAAGRGYHVAAFANAGFVAIAPVRKTPFGRNIGEDAIDEGLSTFLAASSFLHAINDIVRISVVGFGEGGLIALWALARMPDPAKGVVLSPSRLTQGEKRADTMNLDAFLKREEAKAIQAPVPLTVGDLESRR